MRKNVTQVIFLLNIIKVGNFTYTYAVNLVVVDIPEGITSIGFAAFFACRNLAAVSFPKTIKSVGSSAFDLAPV
ncbi:hypothetical protein TrLO_g4591 [Triparma laevis f. longispina]|uniref:Uncharacterized protein n=1 Tax=Triparma laevis f. longispina TaxID=1714387 RepID=A0A9W7L148_9STRA|nr:hypothetical protein TrLO_g4591 [Triparma laevis f. longispina]